MLVSSAVRTVANLFWVLYFKLLPSVGLLHAAFIPKAKEVKLEDVMNSICNSLGMQETEIVREPSLLWNPHFYAIFQPSS
jgi:hypothetical protein